MGAFDIGGRYPYHLTDEASARRILRDGLHAPDEPDGVMADIREALDDRRPAGYPAHTASVFFYPPGRERSGPRVAVGARPSMVRGTCVIAETRLLDDVLDHPEDSEGERRVLDEYWRTARAGPMPEVLRYAGKYSDPEIFCEPPVRAGALFYMG